MKYFYTFVKQKPFTTAGLLLLLCILLFKGFMKWWHHKNKVIPSTIVQTVRVKETAMPSVIETVGNLAAKKEVTLKASAPGKVAKILVESGTFVKAGTELILLVGGPEIRAPYDGYLSDWKVKVGEYVNMGAELVDFINSDVLLLTYRVPEQYAQALDLNQTVEMKVRASRGETFLGKVSFIAPTVDKKSYTILIKAEIDNPSQNLWPGMSANVRHILSVEPNALVVPESSLILTLEGYELLAIDNGKIVRLPVSIGSRHQGRVQVLSGLKKDMQVLLTLNDLTEENTPVLAEDWAGDW